MTEMDGTTTPLGTVLRRSLDAVDVDVTESYKQITVRLHHRGVALRGIQPGGSIGSTRQYLARAGQLILSRIDARNGAIGLVPDDLDGAIVTNDFWLFDVDDARILPKYLDYYVGTPRFVDLCKQASEGTTNRVRLQPDAFLRIPIPLPPLAEQRRIVARVEALAAKIEEARGLRRESVEELSSLVVSIHLHLAGLREVALGEVLTLDEEREAIGPGEQYPQVGVKGFGQGLFARETLDSTQTTYKVFNRLYEGAVVLSQVKGWEGAIAVCPPSLAGKYVSPEYRTFRCVPEQVHSQYMAALVATSWFHDYLKGLNRGVGARRERARPEQFLALKMPMPTVEKQRHAVVGFGPMEPIRRLQTEMQAELEALLPAMLDRAFQGKL